MTAEVKHTPGPWKAVKAAHGPIDIFDQRGRDVVTVYGGGVEAESKSANANLIAAAPDLLDAANKTVDGLAEEYLIIAECDDDWIYDTLGSVLAGAYFSSRAAIAKAEGRS